MTLAIQRIRVPRIAVLEAWLAGAGFLFLGAPSHADAEAQLVIQATAQGLLTTIPRDALAGDAILIVSSQPVWKDLSEADLAKLFSQRSSFVADASAIAMPAHQGTPFPVLLPRALFLDATQGSDRFQIILAPGANLSGGDLPHGAWTALRQPGPDDDGPENAASISIDTPTTVVRLPVPRDQAPDDEPVTLLSLRYTVTAQERARSVAFALETPALASEAALFVWGDRHHEWPLAALVGSYPTNSSADAWASRLGPDRSIAATVACDLSRDGDSPATMLVFALNSHTEREGGRRDSAGVKRAPDPLKSLRSDMIPIDQWIQVAGSSSAPKLRVNGIIAPPFLGPGAEFAEHYRSVRITMSPSGIHLLHHASLEP